MAQSFGDWYFERSTDTRLKDCDGLPCNPTCPISESGAINTSGSPYVLTLYLLISFAWL